MKLSEFRRDVIDMLPHDDGWWIVTLECGHRMRLLLGRDWKDPIEQLKCSDCAQEAKEVGKAPRSA